MKQLMLGNEAIARGAYEAGVTVAAAYPGTPSTEILSTIAKYPEIYAEWSPNEKVALEVGVGASMGGARTLVAMKHVGVNVAADPLFTAAYAGVNGGLVLVAADDPNAHSSQNEQDSRWYGRAAKWPVLEPADSQEAKDYLKTAFTLSEQFDIPVMVRVTTRLAHSQSLVETGERQELQLKEYTKDINKRLMLPAQARQRHIELEERLLQLKAYSEQSSLNRIEWGDLKLGIVVSGVVYQYVKEILPEASVLKLGLTHPFPSNLVAGFARGVERLVVIEELEPIMEEQIRNMGIAVEGKNIFSLCGEYSPELIEARMTDHAFPPSYKLNQEVPARPPLMCPGCPHRGVFYTLNRMKLAVSGDIGCYTLGGVPPLNAMDCNLCMGASIGTLMGWEKARGREFARKSVAVIGDSTFVHSGITGLIDIVYNQGTSTVLILDNDTTAMTGHQEHPATGRTVKNEPTSKLDLVNLVKALGVEHIQVVDPLRLDDLRKALEEELDREKPSVIITKRPCALLVEPPKEKYYIDSELCKGCRACIRLGCTGVYWKHEQKLAVINPNACVTCGLCQQVCTFDAVKIVEG